MIFAVNYLTPLHFKKSNAMKTSILLVLFLFIIPGSLIGQTGKFKYKILDLKKDFPLSNDLNKNFQLDIHLNAFNYNDLPAKIKSQKPTVIKSHSTKLSQDSLFRDHLKIRHYPDSVIVEEYPGSSKFYAKSYIKPYPYEKSFIIKPDTTVKYYLIIKDPILHKITN